MKSANVSKRQKIAYIVDSVLSSTRSNRLITCSRTRCVKHSCASNKRGSLLTVIPSGRPFRPTLATRPKDNLSLQVVDFNAMTKMV